MSDKYKVTSFQVSTKKTTLFKRQETQYIYKIFHNVNCARSILHTYLMEYSLCNKQYVGKAETSYLI